MSAVTVAASCLYSVFSLPDFEPVDGEKAVSRVTYDSKALKTIKDEQDKQTFNPGSNLSAISTVVFKVLSVLHFSVRVMPRSFTCSIHDQILDSRFSEHFANSQFTLYLVSRLPATFPLSMLEDPPDVNSTPVSVLVLTYKKYVRNIMLQVQERI